MADAPRIVTPSRTSTLRARITGAAFCAAVAALGLTATSATGGAPLPLAEAAPPQLAAAATPSPAELAAFARLMSEAAHPSPTPTATPAAVPPTPAATPPAPPAAEQPSRVPAAPPAVASTATTAPLQPPPAAPASSDLDTSPMDAASQQLFDMTNGRRIASGLPPLRANGLLVGVARIRSRDMAMYDYFAHISPVTGEGAFSLMDKYGVPYAWAGENLAKNNYPPDQAVTVAEDALWNSAPHRENILNQNYTDVGIAFAVGATGMNYFTIIFTGP